MAELGTLRGVITVLTLVAFLGVCWWAYRPASRERFEEDGWLPFEEDGDRPRPTGEECS